MKFPTKKNRVRSELQIRAQAMRMADMLSRVALPADNYWRKGTEKHEIKQEGTTMKLKDWPDIDVDYLLPENADALILVDDGKEPAIWPIDVAVALPNGEGVKIAMARTINMSALRGVGRRFSKYNCVASSFDISKYGEVVGFGQDYFGRFGSEWVNLCRGGNYVAGYYGDRFAKGVPAAIGVQLRQRYEWSAVFSFPSGIRLRFGCSAEGALQLFKDREKLSANRRSALLHWVRRHWRMTSDPDVARAVKQHLRGVTEFQWRGMNVSVIPSEYEIDMATYNSKTN